MSNLRQILCFGIFALLLTLIVFLTTKITEYNNGFDYDGNIYAKMVAAPAFECSSTIPPPYCQRVLTPKLVGLLEGTLLNRFRWVAFIADVLSLCLLYGIIQSLGYPIALRYLGVLLYAGVFWTLKFSFYAPAYIDHVSQCMLLSVIYTTLNQKYALATGILALSALQ